MSWNSKNKTPKPPQAFAGSNQAQVANAIKLMAREQRHMAVRHLSVEDLRQLFIPAQHRDALRHAFDVAAPRYNDQDLQIEVPMTDPMHHLVDKDRLTATFTWDHATSPDGFFVPRDGKGILQQDISSELHDKWNYAAENLARVSYEFGLVNMVYERLNKNGYCNTPQQMRYVWPAIRHIADKAGLKLDLAEASARAGDRALMPREVREFLVPTVNIVNRTLLIDKIDTGEKRPFKLAVNAPSYVVTTPESLTGTVLFLGLN